MIQSKDQILELKKCAADPVYFINNYIYFYDTQDNKKLDLRLWDFQEQYAKAFYEDRFIIALKSRQLGFTTVTLAMTLHEAMFHKNVRVVIMAQTESDAANLLNNVKYMYLSLPDFMRPEVGRDSVMILEFPKLNSSIEVKACSPKAGRSIQATHIVLDEFAFYNVSRKSLDEEIYTAIYPTISRKGRLTIISTPNGMGNMYHRLTQQAEAGDINFRLFKLMWNVRKDRDEAWHQETLKALGPKRFAQEYECSFLQSGLPIFNSEYLHIGAKHQPPIAGHKYVIGADVAEGISDGDFSVAYALDLDTMEQVAELRGHWPPDKYAQLLDEMGRMYHDAVLAPERNNMGSTVLLRLRDLNYPNLYMHTDGKPGWLTSGTTKPIMINELEEALRKDEVHITSPTLLSELQAFQDLGGGKMGAPSSCHDDCVMAMAITYQMRKARRPKAWGAGHRPAGL